MGLSPRQATAAAALSRDSTLNGFDRRCPGEHTLILAPIKSKSGPKSTGLIAQSELMAAEVIKIPFNLTPIYHCGRLHPLCAGVICAHYGSKTDLA